MAEGTRAGRLMPLAHQAGVPDPAERQHGRAAAVEKSNGSLFFRGPASPVVQRGEQDRRRQDTGAGSWLFQGSFLA